MVTVGRILCKHLSRAAAGHPEVLAACEPPVEALLERGVWSEKRRYSRVFETRFFVWTGWPSSVYIGVTPESVWVSVITRRRKKADIAPEFTGEYFMFSYNIEDAAWAYSRHPPGAKEIRGLLGAMDKRGLLTAPSEPLLSPSVPEIDDDEH